LIRQTVHEVLQTAGHVAEVNRRAIVEEIVIDDVVTTEVGPKFQIVLAAIQREIIDELRLRDIPALWEFTDGVGFISAAPDQLSNDLPTSSCSNRVSGGLQ
jgi:hypothetical protein